MKHYTYPVYFYTSVHETVLKRLYVIDRHYKPSNMLFITTSIDNIGTRFIVRGILLTTEKCFHTQYRTMTVIIDGIARLIYKVDKL